MQDQSRAVQTFNFQGHEFRVKVINGEPWFVLVDICKVLDLDNVSRVIDRLDGDGVTTSKVTDSLGREQNTTLANEPNLYRLIFESRKPEAKAFQNKVFNEVLPSIRKTGRYADPERTPEKESGELFDQLSFLITGLQHNLTTQQLVLNDLQRAQARLSGKSLREMSSEELNADFLAYQREKRIRSTIARRQSGKQYTRTTSPLTPEKLDAKILEALQTPTTAREISRYIRRNSKDIQSRLNTMIEQGILTKERTESGRTFVYKVAQQGE